MQWNSRTAGGRRAQVLERPSERATKGPAAPGRTGRGRWARGGAIGCAVAGLLTVAVAVPTAGAAGASSLTQVNIGINAPVASEVQPLLAQQAGIFQKLGINANVKVIPASELLADMAAGKVQFGAFGSPQPEEAAMHGAPLKWVAQWQIKSTLKLLGAPGIKDVAGLKGATIGITVPGSLIDILARLALSTAHVPVSTVKLDALQSTSAVTSAFAAGTIQSGILSPPQSTVAVKDRSGSSVLLQFGQHYSWPQGGLAAYMPWVKSHKKAAQAVVTGIAEAVKEFNTHPTTAMAAVHSMSPATPSADLQVAYTSTKAVLRPTIVPSVSTEKFVLSSLQKLYPGQYPKAKPSKAKTFIDSTFAKTAMKKVKSLK